jgi:hypothetical protein
LYGGGNDTDTLASFGIPASAAKSFEDEACLIWPQNWKILQLFVAMGTQWRIGMGGPTGLDYSTIPIVATAMKIKLKPSVLASLRVMEGEALRVMGEGRKKPSKP